MNNTSMQKFNWQGNDVNTVIIDSRTDQPWFVANEVTRILGFDKAGNACRMLDDDEKQVVNLKSHNVRHSPRGNLIISESGLYSLIMRSRKPDARKFRRWVTGEVLPTIRQTGAYLAPETAKNILEDPQTAVTLAQEVLNLNDQLSHAKSIAASTQAELDEAKPKLDRYDKFMGTDKLFTLREAAKLLCHGRDQVVGPNKLTAALREKGIFTKTGYSTYVNGRRRYIYHNMPKQHLLERNYFELVDYDNDQRGIHTSQTKVTPGGLEWLDRLIGQGDLVV